MKACSQDSLSEPNFAPCKFKAGALFSEEPEDVEIQNVIVDQIIHTKEGDGINKALRDLWF